jgi:uracil-DNA glycosylase family 4
MKPFVVPGAGAGPEFFGAIADQLARAERASALGSRRAPARPAAPASTPANTSSALAQTLAGLKDLDAFWSWVDGEYPQWFPGTTAPVVRALGHGSPRLAVVELKPAHDGVFAGANGALLDRMMTAIGVTRDQMYLTSLLKSVPAPGGKALARKDIARMVPVLLRELQLAQCGLVLILGETCAQAVLKTGRSIPELLRAPVETDGLSLSATWHPEEIRAADEAHAPPTGGKPERPRATQAWDHLQWVRGILPAR